MVRFKKQKELKVIKPTATSSEQSGLHHDLKDKLTNLDIDDHHQAEKEITDSSFEVDFTDKNHLKHYAHEIIEYTATKIDINQNGAILLTPHWRQLPSELVSLIVSYCPEQRDLYALSLVNKQFHAIANPLLWCAPKLQTHTAMIKFLNCIAKLQSSTWLFIRKMDYLCSHSNSNRISLLIPHLRHLEELRLIHHAHYCPKLARIGIDCLGNSLEVFTTLGQHCHHLRQLTLSSTRYIAYHFLELLVHCPLQKLTLSFQHRHQLGFEYIVRGLMKFNLLTHLVIYNLYTGHGSLLFQESSDIDPPWPRLSLLHVESCETLSDNDLITFVNSHPHLTELRLRNVKSITDHSLLAIGAALSSLTTLYLHQSRQISEDGILKLIKKCRQLTSLTLDHCGRIAHKKMELDQNALDSIRKGRITTINH
ncbi:unnamed protein product [Absidia cylindrospora]